MPRKQYDQVTKDLRPIYTRSTQTRPSTSSKRSSLVGEPIPIIGRIWREAWQYVIPFLSYETEVRRVLYTTNAIEALNRQLRKAIRLESAAFSV